MGLGALCPVYFVRSFIYLFVHMDEHMEKGGNVKFIMLLLLYSKNGGEEYTLVVVVRAIVFCMDGKSEWSTFTIAAQLPYI